MSIKYRVSFVKTLLLSIPVLILIPFFFAYSYQSEKVDSVEVLIEIHADGRVKIEERIIYNFGDNERRGIFREIPLVFSTADREKFRVDISDIEVYQENGTPYEYDTKEGLNFLRIDVGGDVPELTGRHMYIIEYVVNGAMVDQDESLVFHWNVIGLDWEVPITHLSSEVRLLGIADFDSMEVECKTGFWGSSKLCDSVEIFASGTSSPIVVLVQQSDILPGEAVTLYLSLPEGTVITQELNRLEELPWFIYILIIVTALLPLLAIRKIYKMGVNPKEGGPDPRKFEPPIGVSPLLAGIILKRDTESAHLVAELINLAIRGYIKIVHFQTKRLFFSKSRYLYLKTKDDYADISREKVMVMDAIFHPFFAITKDEAKKLISGDSGISPDLFKEIDSSFAVVDTKKMRFSFQWMFKRISEANEKKALDGDFFTESPKAGLRRGFIVSLPYFIISLLFSGLVVFFVLNSFRQYNLDLFVIILTILSFAWILILFAFMISLKKFMPRRTDKGALIKKELLGLREYISVAEKDRFDFHYDPRTNPKQVERILPFAVVLGLGHKWVKHLDNFKDEPRWCLSTSASGGVSTLSAIRSMSSIVSTSVHGAKGGSRVGTRGGAGFGAGGGGGGSR